jgi:hypothetical protein
MKEHRKARELAETYVFGNKEKLTSEDLAVIKKSPFSNVLIEEIKSPFIELVKSHLSKLNEQSLEKSVLETEQEESQNPSEKTLKNTASENLSIQRTNRFYSGVAREEIIELIRAIEDKFELEVPYRYSKLEVSKLKDFIKTYSERHIFDESTLNLVLRIAEKEHPEEIMGALRVNIGR